MFERPPSFEETEALRSLRNRVSDVSTLDTYVDGWGAECYVQTQSRDVGKVYGTTWTPILAREAKKIFYANRILHGLFPSHFPKIHFACGTAPGQESHHWTGTIRERVIQTPHPTENPDNFVLVVLNGFKHFFDEHLTIDFRDINFIEDAAGNLYYVDTYVRSPAFEDRTAEEMKVIESKLSASYTPTLVSRTLKNLRRLHALTHLTDTVRSR